MSNATRKVVIDTLTIQEPSRADSAEMVENFPRATGEDIRRMMRKHDITIARAAQVLGISQMNVRTRRKDGAEPGVHSWEWMRALPDRHRTMQALYSSDRWYDQTNHRTVKLFGVIVSGDIVPCIAMRLEISSDAERLLMPLVKRTGPNQLLFGRLDLVGTEGVLQRQAEDHVSVHGSAALAEAHTHVDSCWDTLASGDVIDADALLAARKGDREVRQAA